MSPRSAITPDQFTTFGELLKFLRHRAGLTQREFSIAVNYSEGQISHLEHGQRAPDTAVLKARFVPALELGQEPEWMARLLELGAESRGERRQAEPQPSTQAPPSNLPIPLTSFVGRGKEIAEIRELLTTNEAAERVRLLTLTGAGGVGKTRLALKVASELIDGYSDGVWLIDLAALYEPTLVPQSVAAVLGLREEPNRSVKDTLTAHLRPKKSLLVFDNCEHLIEPCAQLVQALLTTCPGLQLLATSREALGIFGERTYVVPSLAVPSSELLSSNDELNLATLSHFDAVRLFVERAVRVSPGFRLTPDNSRAVTQVCNQLDGVPLAIELAAARLSVLSVEQLATRLNDRFHLLTGGSRTALPRHQTLQAAIDWSYELLTEPERVLLWRSSVFAGGCTLEAAEEVCSDGVGHGIVPNQILDLLSHLVDKSLLLVDRRGGETRYHMLETIRLYASEKLAKSEESGTLRDRHLDYFVMLAEEGKVRRKNAERVAWTDRLEREQDNLRAAMGWALESDVEKGLRLAGAMEDFWLWRGYFTEGRDWSNRMLANADKAPAALVINALHTAGFLAVWQSDHSAAHALLEQSAVLSEEIENKQGLASALSALAFDSLWRGDLVAAERLIERSVALAREIEDKWELAGKLQSQSSITMRRGDYARSRALSEEALLLHSQLGDRWGRAAPLFGLGQIAYLQGDHGSARTFFEESLALWREAGDTNGCALATNALGETSRAMGDYARAAVYYEESSILTPMGVDFGVTSKRVDFASKRTNLGFAILHQDDDAHALALFRESLPLAKKSDDQYNIAICLIGFAGVALAKQQVVRAARLLGASSALLESSGIQLEPADLIENDSEITRLRAQLDDTTFDKACEEGHSLTVDQAIAYAMQTQEQNNIV